MCCGYAGSQDAVTEVERRAAPFRCPLHFPCLKFGGQANHFVGFTGETAHVVCRARQAHRRDSRCQWLAECRIKNSVPATLLFRETNGVHAFDAEVVRRPIARGL